jgi:hypothetical protein
MTTIEETCGSIIDTTQNTQIRIIGSLLPPLLVCISDTVVILLHSMRNIRQYVKRIAYIGKAQKAKRNKKKSLSL